MADDADIAADYAERHVEQALSTRTRHTGQSAESCIDCGDDIPEERRQAISGCQTCVACAGARERRLCGVMR